MKSGKGGLPEIFVGNRQRGVALDLARLQKMAARALPLCLRRTGGSIPVLPDLEQIEVALVSDRTIARVHRQFMDIAGATDVITFDHGEIVVSAATAAREAAERSEPVEREVLRYIVHGLLHLNGHEDAESEASAAMWEAQEAVVKLLWPR